ncbi:MAG: hypothetical protein IRY99_05705, partial [Isosphaeraceae bacterium]|nr:hypothetical protein [Isosphaeraceae bacterium]
MPFAVFRRHQRKLLAILAILAMIAFTLDFALYRGRFGTAAADTVVAELKSGPVRRSDLARLDAQRRRANYFLARISGLPENMFGEFRPFGGTSTRDLVDALILERKADELGLPATAELANRWLRQITNDQLRAEQFEQIRSRDFPDITGEQLLEDIANQLRILQVRNLAGPPTITPLDVFEAYRDQYERVEAQAVAFDVAGFVAKVREPSDEEVRAYYEKYKDILPDRERDTPGFKIPRRVKVEYVQIDASDLARNFRAQLTEKELRDYYNAHKDRFPTVPPELPVNLFAGDKEAKLTPRLKDPFPEVRPQVETALADEKAREVVEEKLGQVREEAMDPFADRYAQAVEENQEAKAQGRSPQKLPTPGDLVKKAAAKAGVTYEATPLLTRDEAEHYGTISQATVGATQLRGETRKFADVFFDTRTPLYDPIELRDDRGRHYLAWKIEDAPPRVPPLDEIRAQVIAAWKMEQARPLARKAAEDLAEQARQANGDLAKVAGSRPVLTIGPLTKLQPSPIPGQFHF